VRAAAAEALAKEGSNARHAAVPLAIAAGDANEIVQQWVASALESIGPPPATEVERLGELLAQGSAATAYWSATLLGRLGPLAAPSTPQLAAALSSTAPEVAQRAAWALSKIGPEAAAARPSLQAAASSCDARLKRLSIDALAALES
jgi:HEAT repeat protein